eukprot:scaffold17807_cov51-Attheya_sp.AAC.2
MTHVLQPNGKFLVSPDPRRGELNVVFEAANPVKVEWKDRRTTAVVDSLNVMESDNWTFERIDTGKEGERGIQTTSAASANSHASTSAPAAASPTTGQVDVLSNILGNMGMPQQSAMTPATTPALPTTTTTGGDGSAGGNDAAPAEGATAPAVAGGTLTLADLQGAMAGLGAPAPVARMPSMGPPLQELATPDAVMESGLLDRPDVVERLLELLPEGQRNLHDLHDNMRSPQVSQALRSLTSCLMPDSDDGSLEGYHSLIANFQLDARDGEASMNAGNPVQAFLDCLLADVQRKQQTPTNNDNSTNSDADQNDSMQE